MVESPKAKIAVILLEAITKFGIERNARRERKKNEEVVLEAMTW
jgi:predicted kinase